MLRKCESGLLFTAVSLVTVLVVASPACATILFEEKVTGGTLDENWDAVVPSGYSEQITAAHSHSPSHSIELWNWGYDDGAKYPSTFQLPTGDYELSAWILSASLGADRRPSLYFNAQAKNAAAVPGYKLIMYGGDMLLGRLGTNGSWETTLGSKVGLGTLIADDNWHQWTVSVHRDGAVNNISVYIDGSLITWDGGAFDGESVVVDGTYSGGTIGIGGGPLNDNRFDDITVVPEPGTCALLVMGLLGLLAYAWRKRR